jgi:hypothetical protein
VEHPAARADMSAMEWSKAEHRRRFCCSSASCALMVAVLVVAAVTLIAPAAASAAPLFQPQPVYGVGSAPSSVAVGDFSGDGQLDLAVAKVARTRCRC